MDRVGKALCLLLLPGGALGQEYAWRPGRTIGGMRLRREASSFAEMPLPRDASEGALACPQVDHACLTDGVFPIIRRAHNDSLTDAQKDQEMEYFCESDCGASYTNHTVAVIRGYCAEAVARNSSRLALSVLRRGARLKKHGHDDDDRDDDDEEEGDLDDIWDPEDDDIWDDCCGWADIFGDDDDGDDDEASGGGGTGGGDADNQAVWGPTTGNQTTTPEPPTPPKEEGDDAKAFRRERPGTALGCIKSSRGDRDFCSTKRGCSFWLSCCAASWARLARAGGYQLNSTRIDQIDHFCPGARHFLLGEKAGCI